MASERRHQQALQKTAHDHTSPWVRKLLHNGRQPQKTYGVTLSETRLGQIIRREGFRLLTARPRHYRQDTQAQDI
ncbi:winged helix-turn-helix domain-containing protein, partial [Acetobacter peroxydans]|uniref:winged helix-turn-helix domain-containing protein n=1 Tax=Acetobacter peroxydans TaxID=104098 RepID=UPI0038D05DBE